ncbi:TonB family protein [Sphingobium sp. ZW T5_29]|uniref:energy transducer TonB n=1 Tax=Sphingobium sp. ZW T5_29 TaxID=3378077 RepID=UPI003853C373
MGFMTMSATGGPVQSGYGGAKRSPVGIGGAIAVHGLLAAAFVLMPRETFTPYVPQILIGNQIPLDQPPPETAEPQPDSKAAIDLRPKTQPARVDMTADLFVTKDDSVSDGIPGGAFDDAGVLPPLDHPRDPILVEPRIDPGALRTFQPDYPGAMVRQGLEGSVTVRVTIGPDGRVTAIERLSATDDAFWIATQRHALRKWRFRPATRDGVPTGGAKILTVHFRLADR